MPTRGQHDLPQWSGPPLPDAETACAVKLAVLARGTAAQWRRMCTLMRHGTGMMRPLAKVLDEWRTRAPGIPIGVARERVVNPPPSARPVARAVADVLCDNQDASRKQVVRKVLVAVSPIWIRDAMRRRLATLLLEDGAEPEQVLDDATLNRRTASVTPSVVFRSGWWWACWTMSTRELVSPTFSVSWSSAKSLATPRRSGGCSGRGYHTIRCVPRDGDSGCSLMGAHSA